MAKKLLVICMMLMVFLSGCSGGEGSLESFFHTEEKKLYDLAEEKWTVYSKVEESNIPLAVEAYWEEMIEREAGMEYLKHLSALDGSKYYLLEEFVSDGEDGQEVHKYQLSCLELLNWETEKTDISFPEECRAVPGSSVSLIGMDVVDGKLCLLLSKVDGDGDKTQHMYAVWFDSQGGVENCVDLLPELDKAGKRTDDMAVFGIRCDGEGCLYLISAGVYLFDREGSYLAWVDSPGEVVLSGSRLPDGRPLFESVNSDETILFCIDELEGEILCRGSFDHASARHINDYGEVLFMGQGGLLRWDAAEGKLERVFQSQGLNSWECEAVLEVSDEEAVIVMHDGETASAYRLCQADDTEEKAVTIYQLYPDQEVELCAAQYSRQSPGVVFEISSRNQEEDRNYLLNQLMAQMTVGEGPDMLVVQRDQLLLLQEQGVLADLSAVLPKELQEQIFQGVLQHGMVGDRIYGITYRAGINTMVVSKDKWPEETWKYQDIIRLMEEDDKLERFECYDGAVTADTMLYDLAVKNIPTGNSAFVDLEGRKCFFDTEEFVSLLEFCKKYGEEPGSREYNFDTRVQLKEMSDGKALAYPCVGNLQDFSHVMALVGDEYHCVGYPSEKGSGNYLDCQGCIVVNGASENMEAVADFLRYVLSAKVQRAHGISSVRKDVLTVYVKEGDSQREPAYMLNAGNEIPLGGKPDGTSFLPEYIELLENSVYSSTWPDALQRIILEEADTFFAGDKTAQEVAGIIQQRVDLYLKE